MAIGELIPDVVADELQREGKIRTSGPVARLAAENTRDAWRTGGGAHVEAMP